MVQNDGKGTYLQTVAVEFEVRIDASTGDFSGVTVQSLQSAAEDFVKSKLGYVGNSAIEIYARRGPGGYRYFYPGAEVETQVAVPLRVGLADLLTVKYREQDLDD